MNVLEELKTLDTGDVGRWPAPFRIAAIAIIFVLVASLGTYFLVYKNKLPLLEKEQARELELKQKFESDQRKAANLSAYKEQLAQMERSFGTMLRQLPGETEIPNLIVDISQTGLGAGLDEKLFETQDESPQGFYAEKPIKIKLAGGFHEIAHFASGVAALPRIVTLHDINIKPEVAGRGQSQAGPTEAPDRLVLEVTAKTYRYLDDDQGGSE
ncbi:MAG: type 4a pilus biogenesis protein PilO [Pseudomonadota bacterium]